MDIKFSESKIDNNCYTVLLPLIGEYYCKNYFDGYLYVYKNENLKFEDIIEKLLLKKIKKIISIGKIRLNKELDTLLCLLVNPYFDETYDFLKKNYCNFSDALLKVLQTQVFAFLASDNTNRLFQLNYVEGAQFYNEHLCYQKSKEILRLLKK